MAKRGRPKKQAPAQEAPREARTEPRADRERRPEKEPRREYGGRGEKKEYTQVSKLFESKFKKDSFGGKVQREKLEALVDRLAKILEAGEAARFNIDLNGKWGPYMSVTNADEYTPRERSQGGYSRGGQTRGRQQESQDSDWSQPSEREQADNDKW